MCDVVEKMIARHVGSVMMRDAANRRMVAVVERLCSDFVMMANGFEWCVRRRVTVFFLNVSE